MRQPRYLTTGALAKGAIVRTLALATLIACGCGPVEYFNQVGIKAGSAVSAAKLAQADRYAPYEYTAAEEYLHKAREEAGYAQYQDSIEFGRKAEELAHRARAIAITRLGQPTTSRISSPLLSAPSANSSPGAESPAPSPSPSPPDDTDLPRPAAPRKRSESE